MTTKETEEKEETKEVKTLNLYEKLSAIAYEIGVVKKDGTNTFHRYNYVSESNLMETINPLLHKYGVVIIPSVERLDPMMKIGDKGEWLTTVMVQYLIVDVENPEDRTVTCCFGQGTDKGDKGVYKAITGAYKYFLLKTFQIASDDDPENDSKVKPKAKPIAAPVAKKLGTISAAQAQAQANLAKKQSQAAKKVVTTQAVGDDAHDAVKKKLTQFPLGQTPMPGEAMKGQTIESMNMENLERLGRGSQSEDFRAKYPHHHARVVEYIEQIESVA